MKELLDFLNTPIQTTYENLAKAPYIHWIDWRDKDEWIIEDTAKLLALEQLTCETQQTDKHFGYQLILHFGDKALPLVFDTANPTRDTTLIALNHILAPTYQIRFWRSSLGSDTLAFLPLPSNDWAELEATYPPDYIKKFFAPITPSSKMFALSINETIAQMAEIPELK